MCRSVTLGCLRVVAVWCRADEAVRAAQAQHDTRVSTLVDAVTSVLDALAAQVHKAADNASQLPDFSRCARAFVELAVLVEAARACLCVYVRVRKQFCLAVSV